MKEYAFFFIAIIMVVAAGYFFYNAFRQKGKKAVIFTIGACLAILMAGLCVMVEVHLRTETWHFLLEEFYGRPVAIFFEISIFVGSLIGIAWLIADVLGKYNDPWRIMRRARKKNQRMVQRELNRIEREGRRELRKIQK